MSGRVVKPWFAGTMPNNSMALASVGTDDVRRMSRDVECAMLSPRPEDACSSRIGGGGRPCDARCLGCASRPLLSAHNDADRTALLVACSRERLIDLAEGEPVRDEIRERRALAREQLQSHIEIREAVPRRVSHGDEDPHLAHAETPEVDF